MAEIALRDYLTEIDTLIEGSSYDEAIAHCRHVLGNYPKCLEVYRLLGKAALEKEDDKAAIDLFQRVLSVDPEDFVARVGLSIAFDRQGALDDALWQMERGFELMPSNDVIQTELRRLYGRRDGLEPERIALTRGALARMYAQGDLYDEAIAELHALLKDHPERIDLHVLLTETLWRNEQRNEAASAAERVLDKLPYCLSTNLILGEIWLNSGFAEDGEKLLRRAQAVDPDNSRATKLLGSASPLAEQVARVERFEYGPQYAPAREVPADQVPDWLAGLAGMTLTEPESASLPGLPEPGSGPPIELAGAQPDVLPDWLSGEEAPSAEIGAPPSAEMPDWLSALQSDVPEQAAAPAEMFETAAPAQDEAVPDWLSQLGAMGETAEAPAAEPESAPDWLSQMREQAMQPSTPEESAGEETAEALPDWLSLPGESAGVAQPATEEEAPDWLSRIEPMGEEVESPTATTDWLTEMTAAPGDSQPAEAPGAIEQTELPDWLQSLRPEAAEAAPPPVELPEVEESEVPDWMRDIEATPARDQAFDFLERLGAEAQVEEPVEAEPPSAAMPPAAAPPAAVESGMPSADEALAFLSGLAAGKEDQLRQQAEQEADARMGDIMGRKPPTAPAPQPAARPEPPKPAAPIPPSEPEGLPTADEALAFLQGLAAGKEDELRRQAEEAAEQRMDVIMGGKPGSSPLRPPSQPPAPPAPQPVVKPEPEPASPPVPDHLLSPDEALAFLQSLTAGKEDELRRQAEEAAEQRMDAIMGGKPGTSPLRPPPQPPAPAAPVVAEPEPPAESIEAELAAAEAEEHFTEDALAFLQDITSTEAEAVVEPLPAVELAPSAPIEVEPIEAAPARTAEIFDFWLQTADDEGAEPITVDYFERAVAARTAPSPRAVETPARPAARPAEPERVEAPIAPPLPPIGADEFQSRLDADPSDHEARLGLARVWWASGERERSLELYQQLIDGDVFLDEVAGDLRRDLETFEHADWYRALGDAYMKLGQLAEALDAYRQALTHL